MVNELLDCRMWAVVGGIGLELFELHRRAEGWALSGTILRLHEGQPIEARYAIECGSGWNTTKAEIAVRRNTAEVHLRIENRDGRWNANGHRASQLDGCVDIDLGWSPSTNTLPIRRLSLASGAESGPVIAAWVRFPDLALQPLPQHYTRLTDRHYLYASRGGAFTAELLVDEQGLVEEYKGFWKRVSAT